MTTERARSRVAFGRPLADQGMFRSDLAESRMQLDQARLLVLRTAHLVDTIGSRQARSEISQVKVIAMRTALDVISRAMNVHGALGLSDDTPLARWWGDGAGAAHRRRAGRGPQGGRRTTRASARRGTRARRRPRMTHDRKRRRSIGRPTARWWTSSTPTACTSTATRVHLPIWVARPDVIGPARSSTYNAIRIKVRQDHRVVQLGVHRRAARSWRRDRWPVPRHRRRQRRTDPQRGRVREAQGASHRSRPAAAGTGSAAAVAAPPTARSTSSPSSA